MTYSFTITTNISASSEADALLQLPMYLEGKHYKINIVSR